MLESISDLSRRYSVRPLTEAALPDVLELCRKNAIYYAHYGTAPTLDGLRQDLTALPPGISMAAKQFVGFYRENTPVAILDLINGYPDEATAFIGWFILAVEAQGQGEGSALIGEILAALAQAGFSRVRLAYVKGNPQSKHFWEKNGFAPTGAESPQEHFTAVVMERPL